MKSLRIAIMATVVAVVFGMPAPVRAGEPIEQLSATIQEFVTILANTPVAQLRATGLPDKARQLVFTRFDFFEMTERSLGSHWSL